MAGWLLWFIPPGADETNDSMLLGVYSSEAAALAAKSRLATKPGFVDHPAIVEDTDEPGFMLSPYVIDEGHWSEDFVTLG